MKIRMWPIALILLLILPIARAEETALDKADSLAGQKKYDEALTLLREYDKTHPDDIEVHDRIQRILKRQDKQQDALAEYKKRLEQNPSAFNGYLYARLLESPVERETSFKEIISKDPKFAWGYVGLATAMLDQDRLQDGIDAANEGIKSVADTAELYYIKARIYRRMQDYPAAAAAGSEYNKLKPNDDTRDLAYFYEWLEVTNCKKPEEKVKLADAWIEKYRKDLEKGEGLDGAVRLAEVSFIYAQQDQQPARVRKFAELGLKILASEKPAASGEDRDYYFRTQGALLALQAWAEAKVGGSSRVPSLLKEAQKAGPGSEMYYFSALTQKAMHQNSDALKNALKAASYPPVFPGSKELAESLWKETGANDEAFQQALHGQREQFAADRKKRILSQAVAEKFKPFEAAAPDGKIFSDKDLPGKVTLINFWAVWCPPCREELPHWNEFVAKHAGDENIRMLAVGDEPWETIQNYMANHNYTFPVYRDEKYWDQFSVDGIPTLLVIDPKGTIRFRNAGFEEGMEYEETILWQVAAARGK